MHASGKKKSLSPLSFLSLLFPPDLTERSSKAATCLACDARHGGREAQQWPLTSEGAVAAACSACVREVGSAVVAVSRYGPWLGLHARCAGGGSSAGAWGIAWRRYGRPSGLRALRSYCPPGLRGGSCPFSSESVVLRCQ